MSLHPSFTDQQWEQAPQYRGPGNAELYELCDATILDFDELQRHALRQEEGLAFEIDERGVARAPLKLGHLPAAFYRIDTEDFDVAAVYTPTEPEIWVVLGGVLSVKDARQFARQADDYDTALIPGQVIKVPPQTIAMKALGGFDTATSLALAVFGVQPDPDRLIIGSNPESRAKQTEPASVKLPYVPKINNGL